MSALDWPAYTDAEMSERLRLALTASPPPRPPEANFRCRPGTPSAREHRGVTCSGDERYDDRTGAPPARR
jgi:hypothetical protein